MIPIYIVTLPLRFHDNTTFNQKPNDSSLYKETLIQLVVVKALSKIFHYETLVLIWLIGKLSNEMMTRSSTQRLWVIDLNLIK